MFMVQRSVLESSFKTRQTQLPFLETMPRPILLDYTTANTVSASENEQQHLMGERERERDWLIYAIFNKIIRARTASDYFTADGHIRSQHLEPNNSNNNSDMKKKIDVGMSKKKSS